MQDWGFSTAWYQDTSFPIFRNCVLDTSQDLISFCASASGKYPCSIFKLVVCMCLLCPASATHAFLCLVVGMSLQKGLWGKGSTCQHRAYREAHGAPGRADNCRVSVHLSCSHSAASSLPVLGAAASTGTWLHKWDTRLARGNSLHLLCSRPFTSQPELGSGWESLHKRSKGEAFLEALLSWTHRSSSPGLICLLRLGCLQQHIISANYGVSWETCRIPCKSFEFFISKEEETQRHFTVLTQLHVHCSPPLSVGVSLQQMQ